MGPFVLRLAIGGLIASLTAAAVRLSESNRSRLAPFLALMISIGLLFAFVTGMV